MPARMTLRARPARSVPGYLSKQCLAKSAASLAVQSPLAFSFMSLHHSSLPTSGEHAAKRTATAPITAEYRLIIAPVTGHKPFCFPCWRPQSSTANVSRELSLGLPPNLDRFAVPVDAGGVVEAGPAAALQLPP